MSGTVDWSLVLILVAINGLVDAAGVSYLAGWWSKRRMEKWLSSPESNPYVDRIVAKVVEKIPAIPEVPTVAEIIAEIPPYPDLSDKLALFEERIGGKLTAQLQAEIAGIQEQLSTRVGQVVQANIASAKAAFKSGMTELGTEMEGEDGGILGEIVGTFMDSESVSKLGRIRRLYARAKAAGGGKIDLKSMMGGRSNNGGVGELPRVGEIRPGQNGLWQFTGNPSMGHGGWVPYQQPQASTPPALPPPATSAVVNPIIPDAPPPLPPEQPK